MDKITILQKHQRHEGQGAENCFRLQETKRKCNFHAGRGVGGDADRIVEGMQEGMVEGVWEGVLEQKRDITVKM